MAEGCKGLYLDGSIRFDLDASSVNLEEYEYTWKHSNSLGEQGHKYLYLFTKGQDLSEFSPFPEKYRECKSKIEAQAIAATAAKVSLGDVCFYDTIPEHQLSSWFSRRQEALSQLASRKVGQDYQILRKAHILTSEIAQKPILYAEKLSQKIKYNIFGSVTGRLTTERDSFPILTLKKENRQYLKPQNDAFVELDFNAAEVRTLLALCGKPQPEKDIHEWTSQEVFLDRPSRQEAKIRLFSWLYNVSASNIDLAKIFSRTIFRDFYLPESETLLTPYGRNIKVEERKAQNYLLQSTTSDIVIDNSYEIMKFLENRQSYVSFVLHDSVVLDVAKEDAELIAKIKDKFETTKWGKFLSTCKIGKNFGQMKDLKL